MQQSYEALSPPLVPTAQTLNAPPPSRWPRRLWGLGLGAASTFLWMSGFSTFSTVYFGVVSARMEADVRDLLLAAAVEDVSGVEGLIDRSCTFEESEIDRFMAEVRSAGLTPWSVGISDPLEVSGVVEQVMTVDVTIHAEDRSVWSGTAGFLLVPPAMLTSLDIEGLAPDPRLRNLRLIGPGGRSLRLSGQAVDLETQPLESPAPTTPTIQIQPSPAQTEESPMAVIVTDGDDVDGDDVDYRYR